ncbi:MAG TPA: dUTP diphosphatase [Clostridiales bacterium]|mgnify:CR=1 FL=1|jgi:dUTP pyrophosphatase|nr:dUTP diphosphatase [Clostridiales bacterium]
MSEVKIKKLDDKAVIPTRATPGSAGLDLYACLDEPLLIKGGGHALVPTGIAVQLPDPGLAAFVFARSGLAIRHGLGLLNSVGVIDSDYRGEIKVGLVNQFEEDYEIKPGERIAQLVLMPVVMAEILLTDELDDSRRGEGGFGSTGRV